MNEQGQLNFIDLLSIMSFYIGLLNLDMNITQTDIQKQTTELDDRLSLHLREALNEIHQHLEDQDVKLSEIQQQIKELKNDS